MIRKLEIFLAYSVQSFFVHLFEVNNFVPSALYGADQLIEFDLQRLGIPVLRVLDQKNHKKGDDGRTRIDDELPGVAETEHRSGRGPDDDHHTGDKERLRPAGFRRNPSRETGKYASVIC